MEALHQDRRRLVQSEKGLAPGSSFCFGNIARAEESFSPFLVPSTLLEKDAYASLPLNRVAATYCKYVSARRFARASHLDLFEQPATGFFQHPAKNN
jgi:hypothetical protein